MPAAVGIQRSWPAARALPAAAGSLRRMQLLHVPTTTAVIARELGLLVATAVVYSTALQLYMTIGSP
eukprot:COSAG05_NODE_1271_length_5315_cov_2.397738_5_plen_67_part_00